MHEQAESFHVMMPITARLVLEMVSSRNTASLWMQLNRIPCRERFIRYALENMADFYLVSRQYLQRRR